MAQHRPHTERPLYKMSVQLIDTYKLINKVYYEKKSETQGPAARGGSPAVAVGRRAPRL